jgi:hypothetical protein
MRLIRSLVLITLLAASAVAQTATLRGRVLDESGAVVPGAKVALAGPGGLAKTATSAADGAYVFRDLPPGAYTVQASAPDLALLEPLTLVLEDGPRTLDVQLSVSAARQQVTIEDAAGPGVSTEAANNASALVMRGTDLDALPDDPDDLASALQALAGPSAGPNGGSIFIDGFSGGALPPKESIREIRLNQNPFSPEYDKLGLGRIEIFTKPGTDKFRGSIGYNFANDVWNSRNAYAAEKAPFHLDELSGSLSGPVNKRASFTLNLQREMTDNGNVINAVTLDPQTLLAERFTGVNLSGLRRTGVTPRIDYQIGRNHTLTIRYSFNRDAVSNAGVGSLNLVSRGYHSDSRGQTLQLTETAVLGASVIDETRFQYFRPTTELAANTGGAAIQVLGAFNSGGAQVGRSTDIQNSYEFQNNISASRGKHTWRFGVRLRGATDVNTSPQNFGGTFSFGGGLAPQLDASNQPVTDPTGQPLLVDIDSIERYRRTLLFQKQGLPASQIRSLGGGATQFSINAGNPSISAGQIDAGAFAGDDWKVRPNLTLSLGLRYEAQTNIHDWRDIAPRIGMAWAPGGGAAGSRPKSVIRAGFGMFYDRFGLSNVLTAERFNGLVQQQYIIANPDFFPVVPAVASLAGPVAASTIQQISSTMRAPYMMQSALAFERQLPLNTTAALTFANSHGLHVLRSEVLGGAETVFLMDSSGLYNQNQLILSVNSLVNRNLSLNGSYAYNRADSNTDGLGTFPAKPYSMDGEYGPAATDVRHRVSLAGTITARWGIRFNPLLSVNSGPPFDITAGHDLYGDTLFNGRPGIAPSAAIPGVVATSYGLLDPNPTPGERLLPRNFGRGPGQIMFNVRVGRTFAFGPSREGAAAAAAAAGGPVGGGGNRGAPTSPFGAGGVSPGIAAPANRRFNLTISMYIRNVTNHNNPGPITGDITSPLFGQANQPAGVGGGIFSESANNRRLELQTRLTF